MKKIELTQMPDISGGNVMSAVCTGYNVGSAAFAIGVWANWWNPIGWVGAGAMIATNVACLAYSAHN